MQAPTVESSANRRYNYRVRCGDRVFAVESKYLMKNEAICLCQWYHTWANDRMDRSIKKALQGIDSEKRAHIRARVIDSRRNFIKTISEWHRDSTNTQYLIIVAHGAKNAQGEWIGIGSSPEGMQLERQGRIEWRDFWNVVVKGKKLTGMSLIGCKTAEAAKAFTPLLTKRANNPYLIGLAETVSGRALVKARQLSEMLLENTHRGLFLDEEWELIHQKFPTARLYYPVIAIRGQSARYVDVDKMATEIGMSFKAYLKLENDWLGERYHNRREQRIRRQNQRRRRRN